ncbi:MAG: DUF3857 domain-containing protein [Bacteroidales bacterium]|nr:DUF3857 domain-containing protein [Bacteroidales bacterium]MBR1850722.1 DUF3857 domain-containing protein [Bacteroidales bacterium]
MKKTLLTLMLAASGIYVAAQDAALPDKYAGYNTVTRFDSTGVYMEESGLSHIQNHVRIAMNSLAGCTQHSTFKMDYDPQSAYCDIERVLVHRQGNTDTLIWPGRENNSEVYDYVAPARLIYWGASQKMVEVGHLEIGDELEVWTYKKGFTYALLSDETNADARYIPPMKGHFYDIVPFYASQPVERKVYQLNILDEKNLQYKVYNGDITTHSEKAAEEGRSIYTFAKTDIMPLKREPNALANNDIQCKLLLSTSPDWQTKSRWFYGVNEDYGSFTATPELTKKVAEILNGAKDEADSVARLTHWVADNMRYAGISMGEGEGFTLHNVQMNFTDRCGVCKDKASLLVAMLRAAGFKAYAAMTMAGERIDRIPADQFNHSVCAVQLRNGKFQLLDPTWVPNVRELWSSAEQQQGYLIGTPEGADLQETPISDSKNHYIRILNTCKISSTGDLTGTITITAEGQSDAAVRGVFSARQSEWQRNLELELLRIDPRAEIIDITHTDPDHYLDQPVMITYKYSIANYATVDKNTLAFIPLSARNFYSRAMSHLFLKLDQASRQQPFSDRCSRFIDIKEEVSLPEEYTMLHYPMIDGLADPSASFGCGIQMQGKQLTFGENIMLGKRRYEASEWPAFRIAASNQKKMATTPIILTK